MDKIAIIGSGVMGLRLADYFASKALEVVVLVRANVEEKRRNLEAVLKKRKDKNGPVEYDAVKARIICTESWSVLKDCACILETASEIMSVKEDIFSRIRDGGYQKDSLIATNTSSLPVDVIRSRCGLDSLVGMHFFNPPVKMQLIECCISGTLSDIQETILSRFINVFDDKKIVKLPVISGYVVNRLLFAYLNTCAKYQLGNKVEIETIDISMRLGANMPMGPFELCDYIGIDTTVEILQNFYDETGDSVYQPAAILIEMKSKGELGKKSGHGFYHY